MMSRARSLALLPLIGTGVVAPASAHAAQPGANGAIALGAGNRIILLDAERGHSRILVRRQEHDIAGLAWSPSGRRLAFDTSAGSHARSRIEVVDVRGGRPRALRVTVDARWPAWAPDGRIAFTETVGGDQYIDVVARDGSGLTRLGPGREPTWSPDGRWIAFTRSSDGNCGDVVVSRPDGSGQRIVARGRAELDAHGAHACTPAQSPDFAPDGRSVLVLAPGRSNQDLHVINLGTGSSRRVLRDPRVRELPGAVFSPDGRRIVFAAVGPGPRRDGTFTVDADGGRLRRLTHDAFGPLAWRPLPTRRATRR